MTRDELLALTIADTERNACNVYWGSHACDRPLGHELPHLCGPPGDELCCIHDGVHVQFVMQDGVLSEQKFAMEIYH